MIDIYKQINEERIEEGSDNVPVYEIGQKIYLYYPGVTVRTRPKGNDKEYKTLTAKLTKRWRGPFTVMERLSNTTYKINMNGTTQNVHVERMRDAVTHKQTSIDEYDNDLTLAEAELESIKQTQMMLLEREKSIQQEKEKLKAERITEIPLNTHVICVTIKDDYTHRLGHNQQECL